MHAVKSEGNVIDTDINSEQIFATGFISEEGGNPIEISVQSLELIKIIESLNILFSKIASDIRQFAEETQNTKKDYTEYPYYKWLTDFDLLDFNEIYDNPRTREKIVGLLKN